MTDLNAALGANRAAVNDLLTAADMCEAVWTVPRAPGKWSASQVVEHVARSLEESANDVSGMPTKLPRVPGFLQPLTRVFFNRTLRKREFPKGRTTRAFNPVTGPTSPAEGRIRLEAAFARFSQACIEAALRGEKVEVAFFGLVRVEDYVRFQELHTRHHCKQMPQI